MKPNKKLVIKIDNLTEAQAIAIEEMLELWQRLSSLGSSRFGAFYADGDGNFHAEILINGNKPERKAKRLGINFEEEMVNNQSMFLIDFDLIETRHETKKNTETDV